MPTDPPENIEWSPDRWTPQQIDSPFGARKTAPQFTQLSVDPSQGLTRKRYAWYSNGALFDATLVSEVEAGIELATTATASDVARIRSAYSGQYISQSVAQPGLGLNVDPANVEVDDDGQISLTHGRIDGGAYYWDAENDEPYTGLGYTWDVDGWRFFIKSLGQHIGPSPIPQSEFGIDPGDGTGHSGRVINPANGYIFNWPFTWYNEGPLSGAWINPTSNHIEEQVRAAVQGRASFDTPNLPIQLVVQNNGTADTLTANLGGMQYSTYGAGRGDLNRRLTDETRIGAGLIGDYRALSENAINPVAEPGVPLIAVQREPDRNDITVRNTRVDVQPSEDVIVFAWDEFDPTTALTGADFTDPVSPNNAGRESHILTDTQATDYTPTTATFRGMEYFDGGQLQKTDVSNTDIDLQLPLECTRVFTAVLGQDTNAADVDPVKIRFEEAY
jgi:hypothetical protein